MILPISSAWSMRITLIILLFGASFTLTAQQRLQLLDAGTQEAITDLHYLYGSQRGVSDAEGNIRIRFQASDTLLISHVHYGRQMVSPDKLREALQSSVFQLTARTALELQPVTIVAVKAKNMSEDRLQIAYTDRVQHDAGNFLSQLPGMAGIQKSGSYGYDPVFHGFKYDQLNITLDGVQTAIAACPNRMDPPTSQISLNQIEKVEILRGPHGLRYGPSFGATVNFVSEPIDWYTASPLTARASAGFESNGNIRRTEAQAGYQGESFHLSGNTAYSAGDDYVNGEGVAVPSSFSRSTAGVKAAVRLNSTQTLSLSATRNFARDVDFPALAMDLRSDDSWLLSAQHRVSYARGLVSEWNTAFHLSDVDHVMDNLSRPRQGRMADAVVNAYTQTYGGRSELKLNAQQFWGYAGIDMRHETVSGLRERTMLMGPMQGNVMEDNIWQEGFINRYGTFAEIHVPFQKYHWVVAARLDVNEADAGLADERFASIQSDYASTHINPSFSSGLSREWTESLSTGVWLGRGMRSPNLGERFINFLPIGLDPYELIGNPQLAPEVNNQLDFSLIWNASKTQLEVNIFASYLQDFITSEIREDLQPRMNMAPGVREFVNLPEAAMYGFDLSWQQVLPLGLQQTFTAAYTYGQDLSRDMPLPEIPPLDLRYSLARKFAGDKLRTELSLRHVLAQERIAEYFGETHTPAFTVMDVRAAYQFSPSWEISGGVLNILNATYWEHLSRFVRSMENPIFAPGRNAFLTLSYRVK